MLTHLGNIGRAVGLLMQGKFKEAASTFGDSYAEHMNKAFDSFGNIIQGGVGMVKGNLKGYGDMAKYFAGKLNLGGGYEDVGLSNTKEAT